jgi:hypothetical protein
MFLYENCKNNSWVLFIAALLKFINLKRFLPKKKSKYSANEVGIIMTILPAG